jgi:putative aminopeptidase FrvX
VEFGDYLGSYFLDDRAAVTALLQVMRRLKESAHRPAADVYAVFTTNEEIGGVGGSYASRTLPGDLTLALEVGPTEAEYSTTVRGGPIVGYSDAQCVYDKDIADQLVSIATELGLSPSLRCWARSSPTRRMPRPAGSHRGRDCCACRR